MERIKGSLTLIISGVVGLYLLSNGIETLNDPYIESLDMGFSHTIAVWFGIIGGGIMILAGLLGVFALFAKGNNKEENNN